MNKHHSDNTHTDPFIIIDEETGEQFYGGHQAWFRRHTMSYAGCGVIAAANVLRALLCKYPALSVAADDILFELGDNGIGKACCGCECKTAAVLYPYRVPHISGGAVELTARDIDCKSVIIERPDDIYLFVCSDIGGAFG